MPVIKLVEEHEATGLAKEIFEEMKRVRGWDAVPPIWRAMAVNPEYLAANWQRYKTIMLSGTLDLKTKEAVALAVSMVNRCSYCIDSHSMALRKLGFTDEQLVELAAVVDFFSGTNVFSSGLKIEFGS
ncbi:hypothetical protein SY88_09145 [Clostridiales bacterium PH28_bin88]|nr:hypothetical protein SY88_09145 [Clostridiales bacterium PH28_bin88]